MRLSHGCNICNIWFHGPNGLIIHSLQWQAVMMTVRAAGCDILWNVVYQSNKPITCCSVTRGGFCVHTGAVQQAHSPSNEHELSLADTEKSFPPGFHQHFSPHWWENSGHGQKLYILYKHSSERQHTDSFFSVCENGGGPLSAPLCWCLSTV